MKPRLDERNAELAAILDALLAEDVTITVREVARRHPTLRNASAFTRDVERVTLIEQAQSRQGQLRTALNPHALRASSLSDQLDQKSARIDALENQVKTLVTSHAACIQAVMAAGGMTALQRYWKEYKAIGEALRDLSAFPDSAEVVELRKQKRKP
ncbi:MAG TPA: hypothetical protein VJU59_49370 [Paraburkholderia sp.]|uniref:hypothetical protein n=1 Tax=Paraburkholderia sp. TaxID=1926495 RepID=UPI002B48F1C5|nr:hypothetical protein [Paraburkholderia sp.]HKR47599.1 hypothetical protein [Paraburkholderia sp.]